jgi:hypothetical protein
MATHVIHGCVPRDCGVHDSDSREACLVAERQAREGNSQVVQSRALRRLSLRIGRD